MTNNKEKGTGSNRVGSIGSYTINDRQDGKMDFYESSVKVAISLST